MLGLVLENVLGSVVDQLETLALDDGSSSEAESI